MKSKLPLTIILISICAMSVSCVGLGKRHSTIPTTQFTALQKSECEARADNILLFFDGEKIDFDYTRIGIVEVEGSRNSSNTDIINFMKYSAWNQCADAIINVKDAFRVKEISIQYGTDTRNIYDVKVYNGLAVRIIKDDDFYSKYGSPVDTSFVEFVESRSTKPKNKEEVEKKKFVMTAIIGAIIIGSLMIVLR